MDFLKFFNLDVSGKVKENWSAAVPQLRAHRTKNSYTIYLYSIVNKKGVNKILHGPAKDHARMQEIRYLEVAQPQLSERAFSQM